MTEFTEEKLAELRAVAEAQAAAHERMLELNGGVGKLGVRHPEMFEDMMRWGDSTENEHADTVLALIAALEAKTAEVEGYKQSYPCDGGCSYGDGPQEECSRHGRNPRDLWEFIDGLARERDEARAEVERLTQKQPDGWSTQDRQEAKQEAERRWTDDRDGYQSDFDRGGINGFILGAEWQKARETSISYKAIADEAEAALERVKALHPRKEFDDAPGKFYCDACQRTAGLWPCPTIQAIEGVAR